MQTDKRKLTMKDGRKVVAHHWFPDSFKTGTPPKGMIQILHGMAEHCERYEPVAKYLVERGYAVFSHDHRGHGADCPMLGHFADHDGWNLLVEDAKAVSDDARSIYSLPLNLVGHSMGSFVALDYAQRYGGLLGSLTVSAGTYIPPMLAKVLRTIVQCEIKRQGPHGRSALVHFLSFGAYNRTFRPTQTEFDWLSRDSKEVKKYVDDPLCGFRTTNQLWYDLISALVRIFDIEHLAKIPHGLPLLLMGGERDPVGKGETLRKLADKLRATGHGTVEYHRFTGSRHEIFNETNRKEVFETLLQFLA